MKIDAVNGHQVALKAVHPLHYGAGAGERGEPVGPAEAFADMLAGAIGQVNEMQVTSEDLTRKMITEPESVDIHQVMIAAQKAEISLTLTKTIRDEAVRAYRDLINLR